ncbi:MAG: ABC transporter ATP-binding protein [Firmicutes bacterium]|nr:ABC transporter ATP-binding protein [Bacillota bacterium]
MVSFESVGKNFGSQKCAVNNLTLHIPEGVVTGVIGASGAGKTTLVKLAAGLLEPTWGRVRVMGKEPVRGRRILGMRMGVFMVHVSLFQKDDTVIGNFRSLRSVYRIPERQFNADYGALAERLGFGSLQDQRVSDLSLGERMRAELGAVLIHRPTLLILDEPTVGLDENVKAIFRDIIAERNQAGMTVVMTTHDMAEVSSLCGRIALIDNGKLLYYGSEAQLRRAFMPTDTMTLTVRDRLPDLQDLPLKKYTITNRTLRLSYNTNHVTSAEILKLILQQTAVSEVKILKPGLTEIVTQIQKEAI